MHLKSLALQSFVSTFNISVSTASPLHLGKVDPSKEFLKLRCRILLHQS